MWTALVLAQEQHEMYGRHAEGWTSGLMFFLVLALLAATAYYMIRGLRLRHRH